MATKFQMETLKKLHEQGWRVLGPADNSMGGRTLVENAEHKKFYVGGDGRIVPAPDSAQPVKLVPG